VQSAAKSFFNKEAKDLTLAESAALVAMIQSPSYLSPYGQHKDELLKRKDYVLTRMAQEHYLEPEIAEATQKEELNFSPSLQSIKAPHFVFYVEDYLFEKYGKDALEKNGFKIYTTLDWEMQEKAEKIVAEGVKQNRYSNAYNASLVAIDPKTGEILAMVGSADWFGESYPKNCISGKNCLFDPKVNVATYKIGRQPGSAFKPFVYATAFEKGYNDQTVVVDEETDFGIFGGKHYIPQNYDEKFRGPVTLRQALAQSLNVPSVKVILQMSGIKESIETAKKMGITTLNRPDSDYGPSIVLGGGEVKLLDMVSAFGVFATEGLRYPATPILKIEDSEGKIIEENKKIPRRVLEPEVARLISDILSDNEARTPIFGANSQLYFPDYQVAVKTGTTTDYRDGWTIGYTPSISVGVWAGNNDNTPINKKSGAMIASPMWHRFMEYVLAKYPKENFTKPGTQENPGEGQPTI
jgi:membrane peptidoglycan carboxypeptidase